MAEKVTVSLNDGAVAADITISPFVSKLFASRSYAHAAHLSVSAVMGSEAQHNALGAYYDSITGLIDRLVEFYQGFYGDLIIISPVVEFEYDRNPIDVFQILRDEALSVCKTTQNPVIENISAEILELIGITLYKLRFLK